jgi:hypothetical protein
MTFHLKPKLQQVNNAGVGESIAIFFNIHYFYYNGNLDGPTGE